MIVIDSTSPVPPFEQLRAQLARQIQDRTLAVGTKLPTIRRLAADLGLAVNTVGRTYRELEEAGLIETRGPAGSYVSAAGERGRERARRAAAEYASVIASVGIETKEAIRILQAALTNNTAVSPSSPLATSHPPNDDHADWPGGSSPHNKQAPGHRPGP